MVSKPGAKKPTYTDVFGDWLCDMAAVEPTLMAITPAMREGSGLVRFSKEYPDRYFDVAIAEQHAVTLAAGMACEGAKPVVAIYSTFLQRGYDQLVHDVAIQDLDVLFAIDRGGVVGPDGATHAGNLDLSYLRCVPNMVVMARVGRERVPRNAQHRVRLPWPGRGALSARHRSGRGGEADSGDAADRQGRTAPARSAYRAARVRGNASPAAETGRRRVRTDGRQHAFRQAVGSRAASSNWHVRTKAS